ncbi:hypothetical protein GDO86_003462 [Hymenochirus boettgeri]|uniref:Uncharacterized protein n=1 Tax=Hymenochirus boettgeri TaxID=247094 RepID=A0A8T2K6F1_9PIPI|nr:hypothetical protein GDO86_003462 [Hymenochirus boettgeri]
MQAILFTNLQLHLRTTDTAQYCISATNMRKCAVCGGGRNSCLTRGVLCCTVLFYDRANIYMHALLCLMTYIIVPLYKGVIMENIDITPLLLLFVI